MAYCSFTGALVQMKASPECCISGLTDGPKADDLDNETEQPQQVQRIQNGEE